MTDKLLAEIQHMIHVHEDKGDDDAVFALKYVHKLIQEDRKSTLKAVEGEIAVYQEARKVATEKQMSEYSIGRYTGAIIASVKVLDIIKGQQEEEDIQCQFSGCKETKDVERFWSHEEGYVWLCKEHTELNVKDNTGYPDPERKAEKNETRKTKV